MVNIIIKGKSRHRWRKNADVKFHGVTRAEVEERAREVANMPGATRKDVDNAVREMTMNAGSSTKCWEGFRAGVEAGHAELDSKHGLTPVIEDRIVDIPRDDD